MTLTKTCSECGRKFEIEVTEEEYQKYLDGELIQDAFPKMDRGLRELFISGICPDCWDRIFGVEEDEE